MAGTMMCKCGHKAYVHALYAYADSDADKENGQQCSACACAKCVIQKS